MVNDETTGPKGAKPRPGNRLMPCEIIIRRHPGPGVKGIEIVFLEWRRRSFSVYKLSRAKTAARTSAPEFLADVHSSLNWRQVVKICRRLDFSGLDYNHREQIEVSGVQPWQRDVIVKAMWPRSESLPYLASRSDADLKLLYNRLGSFLSDEANRVLVGLVRATYSACLRRTSLASVAQTVNAKAPLDVEALVEDIKAYATDKAGERVLTRYRNDAAVPPQTFLDLLDYEAPRSLRTRTELFELWMHADSKPAGGAIDGMGMEGELPFLHWLLREQVEEVFTSLVESRRTKLQEFVVWFLGKSLYYAQAFHTPGRFSSFNMYAFGRPRYAAWVRLALEVENAATQLNIAVPDSVKLPAMPYLGKGGAAILYLS